MKNALNTLLITVLSVSLMIATLPEKYAVASLSFVIIGAFVAYGQFESRNEEA